MEQKQSNEIEFQNDAFERVRWLALLALCSAYVLGGVVKLLDFSGAVAEMMHFGLPFPTFLSAAVIITELAAPAMILSGRFRWLGAIWLALFTLGATFAANRFWQLPLPERAMVENTFFEHLGLAGAFILVALTDARRMRRG